VHNLNLTESEKMDLGVSFFFYKKMSEWLLTLMQDLNPEFRYML